jgi:hypothetical protein
MLKRTSLIMDWYYGAVARHAAAIAQEPEAPRAIIQRWEHGNAKEHILAMLVGAADVADGLVTLLSLGNLSSDFEMRAIVFRAERCRDA